MGFQQSNLFKPYKRSMLNLYFNQTVVDIIEEDQIAGWTELHQRVFEGILTTDDISSLPTEQLDVRDKFGQSPMWVACSVCDDNMYSILKEHGSDLKQEDNQNRTLLHATASGENDRCGLITADLIKSGVTVTEDIRGRTFVDILKLEPPTYRKRELDTNMKDTIDIIRKKRPIESSELVSESERCNENRRNALNYLRREFPELIS